VFPFPLIEGGKRRRKDVLRSAHSKFKEGKSRKLPIFQLKSSDEKSNGGERGKRRRLFEAKWNLSSKKKKEKGTNKRCKLVENQTSLNRRAPEKGENGALAAVLTVKRGRGERKSGFFFLKLGRGGRNVWPFSRGKKMLKFYFCPGKRGGEKKVTNILQF